MTPPNSGTVVFADDSGVRRSLDVLFAPFGLSASEAHDSAIAVDILDDAGAATGGAAPLVGLGPTRAQ
jgi:hypothetical protein